MLGLITPPLAGGGWGEGDNLALFQEISPPPQPSTLKGEGEKALNLCKIILERHIREIINIFRKYPKSCLFFQSSAVSLPITIAAPRQ